MDPKKYSGQKVSVSWRSSRDLVCTALAVVLGLVTGWLDLQVTEVSITITALLIAGLLPGLIQPKAAWRWPLLIGICLPVMEIVAINFSLQTAEPVHLDLCMILVALGFAFLGAYTGVFIRYIMRT